jgi:membrane protein YdbS with pleckstrin-like domain
MHENLPPSPQTDAHPVKKLWTWEGSLLVGLAPAAVLGGLAWFGSRSSAEPFQSIMFLIVGFVMTALLTVPLSFLFTWWRNKNARNFNRRHGYPEDGGREAERRALIERLNRERNG